MPTTKLKPLSISGNLSYLASEIEKWCVDKNDTSNIKAEIYNKYFGKDVQFKPNPNTYYFIVHGRECHQDSLYSLVRDLVRSPRKAASHGK